MYVTAEDAEYVAVPTADKASNAIASGIACISWQLSGGIVTIGSTKYAVRSLTLGTNAQVVSGVAYPAIEGASINAVSISTTNPTAVLAVTLSGLQASMAYHAILKTTVILWDSETFATCGSVDFNTDLAIVTSALGVATVTLVGTPFTDITRTISASTSAVAASTGGFTISATLGGEFTAGALAIWSIPKLTLLGSA